MKLSILMPVYNERKFIREVIRRVISADTGKFEKEIIIVDDGSSDGTADILSEILKRYNGNNAKKHKGVNVKVIFHKNNGGKSMAIRTALANATGEYCIVQDADLEYRPEEIIILLRELVKRKANAVYGTRFSGKHNPKYRFLYFGNKMLTMITNIMYFSSITDMETGYKLVRTSILKKMKLKAEGFGMEPEITAKLLKKGVKIYEVPINYVCRDYEEGKKISWKDGIKAALYLLKFRIMN